MLLLNDAIKPLLKSKTARRNLYKHRCFIDAMINDKNTKTRKTATATATANTFLSSVRGYKNKC